MLQIQANMFFCLREIFHKRKLPNRDRNITGVAKFVDQVIKQHVKFDLVFSLQ